MPSTKLEKAKHFERHHPPSKNRLLRVIVPELWQWSKSGLSILTKSYII